MEFLFYRDTNLTLNAVVFSIPVYKVTDPFIDGCLRRKIEVTTTAFDVRVSFFDITGLHWLEVNFCRVIGRTFYEFDEPHQGLWRVVAKVIKAVRDIAVT